MSNHIKNNKIWLVGAGGMAVDYVKVLQAQNIEFDVIGRGKQSAELFSKKTGVNVYTGGLDQHLQRSDSVPEAAIVAVSVEQLAETTLRLMQNGIKRILVEKPAGINFDQIQQVTHGAKKNNAQVFVAYNRRFYASVLKAKEIIDDDGGVTSFNFEFTEWSHEIEKLEKAPGVKESWFFANSTHVVDLAFYLGGKPQQMSCYIAGSLDWHPTASRFAGAGISENGALFSYQANWDAPGRWGVEMLTKHHRLILRPMEQLCLQKIGSVAIENVEINDELDIRFKPGLYRQVAAFLTGKNESSLINICQQQQMSLFYKRIAKID